MNYKRLFFIGIAGGIVMSLVQWLFHAMGLTNMHYAMMWGPVITREMGMLTMVVGFLIHLLISGLVAMAYAPGFKAMQRYDMGAGVALSLVHWLVSGTFVLFFPAVHPFKEVPGPGFLALGMGAGAFISFLVTHLAFGATVGAFSRHPAQKGQREIPPYERREAA